MKKSIILTLALASQLLLNVTINYGQTRDFGRYVGGTGNDGNVGVAIGEPGFYYVLGNTTSSGLSSLNSYQGNQDAYVAKYKSDGTPVWFRYFGGSSEETPRSIAVNRATGDVYITGDTKSSSGIATTSAHNGTFLGTTHAFIAKFTSKGALSWSTYYGGQGSTYGFGIALDEQGSVHVCGGTTATKGIATSGAYKTSAPAQCEAYITKFTSTGARVWGTYFGDNARIDQAFAITIDAKSNIIITGITNSLSGISTSGVLKTSNISLYGYSDAFIAKFSSNGSILNAATYFGGDREESGIAITTDSKLNIYLTGMTTSTSGLSTNGTTNPSTISPNNRHFFIAKINSTLSTKMWTTYFGGAFEDVPTSIALDAKENIFVAGWTLNAGLATSGRYQTNYNQGYLSTGGVHRDGIIVKYNSNLSFGWATYYGGTQYDAIEGIAFDADKNLVFAGQTGSSTSIATTGSISRGLDGFIGKFKSALLKTDETESDNFTDIAENNELAVVNPLDFKLFPNPMTGNSINFQMNNNTSFENYNISVTDISGRVVYQNQFSGNEVKQIELNVPVGMYQITLQNQESTITKKFIKQ